MSAPRTNHRANFVGCWSSPGQRPRSPKSWWQHQAFLIQFCHRFSEQVFWADNPLFLANSKFLVIDHLNLGSLWYQHISETAGPHIARGVEQPTKLALLCEDESMDRNELKTFFYESLVILRKNLAQHKEPEQSQLGWLLVVLTPVLLSTLTFRRRESHPYEF